jgi:hypothetical protein
MPLSSARGGPHPELRANQNFSVSGLEGTEPDIGRARQLRCSGAEIKSWWASDQSWLECLDLTSVFTQAGAAPGEFQFWFAAPSRCPQDRREGVVDLASTEV